MFRDAVQVVKRKMGDRNVFAGRVLLLGMDNPRCAGEDPTIIIIFQLGHCGRE